MTRILLLGDVNADIIMPIPYYPGPGGDIVTDGMIIRTGGSAANTAAALVRLGLSATLIARAGGDTWGEEIRRTLAEIGVDTRAIERDPDAPTGIVFAPVLPNGERTLFCARGANNRTDPASITPELFDDTDWLHLSGYALLHDPQRLAATRAVELAAQRRIPISLDTALEPARLASDEMRWLMPQLALCVLGLAEARRLTGRDTAEAAARALLLLGTGFVGVKLGEGGCLVASREGMYYQMAFSVKVVDTTGAGDAFSAGLVAARLARLSLPASALLASALGAIATTVSGAGPSLPGRGEVAAFLRQQQPAANEREWFDEVFAALDRPART